MTRTIRSIWAVAAIAAVVSFASCQKNSVSADAEGSELATAGQQNYSVTFDLSPEFAGKDLLAPKAAFKNLTTGEVTTVRGKDGVTAISASLPQAEYTVEISAYIQDQLNGKAINRRVSATLQPTLSFKGATAEPLLLTLSSNPFADFKIEEVFFTGTAASVRDQYFKITNNGDVNLYIDSLIITEGKFVNTSNTVYTPDVYSTDFAVHAVYQIPGTGTQYAVAAGASIVVADRAFNFKTSNPASRNLAIADFEWYDNHAADVDYTAPNLIKIFSASASIWVLHNRGWRSYAIGKLGTTQADFLANYKYEPSYVNGANNPDTVVNSYRVPLSWIADGVNLLDTANFSAPGAKLWIHSSVDAGFTGIDPTNARFGKSVIRKKDLAGYLIDTDNSSNDFNYGGTTPSVN